MAEARAGATPLTIRAASIVEGATGPADVLSRLIDSGHVVEPLRAIGVDPRSLRGALHPDSDLGVGSGLVLEHAEQEARALGHDQVDAIHVLMGLLYNDLPSVARPLVERGVNLYDLRTYAVRARQRAQPAPHLTAPGTPPTARRRVLPLAQAVRPSPVFLVPVAAFAAGGVALYGGPPGWAITPLTILCVAGGWITSLCLHEFGHALVAYLGGDGSVAEAGYLSLNPLRYAHRVLSFVLPLVFLVVGGIGLPGGAVYVDRTALRSRSWDAMVSAAGPCTTLACAASIGAVFAFAPGGWFPMRSEPFWAALAWLGVIEVSALVLNLLPIPPFDGWGIVSAWLSWETRVRAAALGSLSIFLVFFLLWQGPVANVFWSSVFALTSLGQIPAQLADLGRMQMMLGRPF